MWAWAFLHKLGRQAGRPLQNSPGRNRSSYSASKSASRNFDKRQKFLNGKGKTQHFPLPKSSSPPTPPPHPQRGCKALRGQQPVASPHGSPPAELCRAGGTLPGPVVRTSAGQVWNTGLVLLALLEKLIRGCSVAFDLIGLLGLPGHAQDAANASPG